MQGIDVTGILQGFPTSVIDKSTNILWGKDMIALIGNLSHIHRVSLRFLQLFSINSTGKPCRHPVMPCARTFHGVKICSAVDFCHSLVLLDY